MDKMVKMERGYSNLQRFSTQISFREIWNQIYRYTVLHFGVLFSWDLFHRCWLFSDTAIEPNEWMLQTVFAAITWSFCCERLIKTNKIYFYHDKNKLLDILRWCLVFCYLVKGRSCKEWSYLKCFILFGAYTPLLYWRIYAELFVVVPFVFVCLFIVLIFILGLLSYFFICVSLFHLFSSSPSLTLYCPFSWKYFCSPSLLSYLKKKKDRRDGEHGRVTDRKYENENKKRN